MYERTDDHGKRLANQAFYQRILITEDEKAAIQLNEPFAALAPNDVRCSNTYDLVDAGGLSPNTWDRLEWLSSAWEHRHNGVSRASSHRGLTPSLVWFRTRRDGLEHL